MGTFLLQGLHLLSGLQTSDSIQVILWDSLLSCYKRKSTANMTSFFYMPEDQIFIPHSYRISTEFLSDNQNLISSGFVQWVLLCKTSNREPEEMELKTASWLAVHNHFSLLSIASVSYFSNEKITLIVYFLSILLIRKKCVQKILCQPFKIFVLVIRAHLNNCVYSYLSVFHSGQYPLAA